MIVANASSRGHPRVGALRQGLVLALVVAGLGSLAPGDAAASTSGHAFVTILADGYDYVTLGQDRFFHDGNATISVSGNLGQSLVRIDAAGGNLDDEFALVFGAPPGDTLQAGDYERARRPHPPEEDMAVIVVEGDRRSCGENRGRFRVKELEMGPGGAILDLWIVFEQHCGTSVGGLLGEVRYSAAGAPDPLRFGPREIRWADTYPGVTMDTLPITVVNGDSGPMELGDASILGPAMSEFEITQDDCAGEMLPIGGVCRVWVRYVPSEQGVRKASLHVPAGGTELVSTLEGSAFGGTTSLDMQSELGDWIGQGEEYAYAPPNARFRVFANTWSVWAWVDGTDGSQFRLRFEVPEGETIGPGSSYTGVTGGPFDRSRPRIDVSGNNRACTAQDGAFSVEDLALNEFGDVDRLDMAFEQRCETDGPALRGTLRFRAGGPTPVNVSVTAEPTTHDETAHVTASLVDATSGGGLVGETLILKVKVGSLALLTEAAATDERGEATFTFPASWTPGSYPLHLSYAGTSVHGAGAVASSLEILPRPTVLTYQGATSGFVGVGASLQARLVDELSGDALSAQRLVFTVLVDDEVVAQREAVTDGGGVASATFAPQVAEHHELRVDFAGTDARIPSAATGSFESVRRLTSLSYQGDGQAGYGAPVTARALLTDETLAQPVANAAVRFSVGGYPPVLATTDADGVATAQLDMELSPGDHTVRVEFDGDGVREASGVAAGLTVVPAATDIQVIGEASGVKGTRVTIGGRLVDADGDPMEGETVRLRLGDTEVEARTDEAGRAFASVLVTQDFGEHDRMASFQGDWRYEPSSDVDAFEVQWETTYRDDRDESIAILLNPPTRELRFQAPGDDTGWFHAPGMQTTMVPGTTGVVTVRHTDEDVALAGTFVRQTFVQGYPTFAAVVKTATGVYAPAATGTQSLR